MKLPIMSAQSSLLPATQSYISSWAPNNNVRLGMSAGTEMIEIRRAIQCQKWFANSTQEQYQVRGYPVSGDQTRDQFYLYDKNRQQLGDARYGRLNRSQGVVEHVQTDYSGISQAGIKTDNILNINILIEKLPNY